VQRTYCHFLRGAIIGVLKACGTRSQTVTEEGCVLKGDAACAFRARWE
jgi:predicted hydrocarbon binding protein